MSIKYWKYPHLLQRMCAYMEEHFRENITSADIAHFANYSVPRCNYLFRTYFGESPVSYLRRLRLRAAKEDLKCVGSVGKVAHGLAFSSHDTFCRAFRKEYGITPSEYLKGGQLNERYKEIYEYRHSHDTFGSGMNPSRDGLWEYSYYDLNRNEHALLHWIKHELQFSTPYSVADKTDPLWYCFIRQDGYGLHPAKGACVIKSFICPHEGNVEVFFSVGRVYVFEKQNSLSVFLYHNDQRLAPLKSDAELKTSDAAFLRGTCSVRAGDRISLVVKASGEIYRAGVLLYRQRIAYLK